MTDHPTVPAPRRRRGLDREPIASVGGGLLAAGGLLVCIGLACVGWSAWERPPASSELHEVQGRVRSFRKMAAAPEAADGCTFAIFGCPAVRVDIVVATPRGKRSYAASLSPLSDPVPPTLAADDAVRLRVKGGTFYELWRDGVPLLTHANTTPDDRRRAAWIGLAGVTALSVGATALVFAALRRLLREFE